MSILSTCNISFVLGSWEIRSKMGKKWSTETKKKTYSILKTTICLLYNDNLWTQDFKEQTEKLERYFLCTT